MASTRVCHHDRHKYQCECHTPISQLGRGHAKRLGDSRVYNAHSCRHTNMDMCSGPSEQQRSFDRLRAHETHTRRVQGQNMHGRPTHRRAPPPPTKTHRNIAPPANLHALLASHLHRHDRSPVHAHVLDRELPSATSATTTVTTTLLPSHARGFATCTALHRRRRCRRCRRRRRPAAPH